VEGFVFIGFNCDMSGIGGMMSGLGPSNGSRVRCAGALADVAAGDKGAADADGLTAGSAWGASGDEGAGDRGSWLMTGSTAGAAADMDAEPDASSPLAPLRGGSAGGKSSG
jgi:hypothetical protein